MFLKKATNLEPLRKKKIISSELVDRTTAVLIVSEYLFYVYIMYLVRYDLYEDKYNYIFYLVNQISIPIILYHSIYRSRDCHHELAAITSEIGLIFAEIPTTNEQILFLYNN